VEGAQVEGVQVENGHPQSETLVTIDPHLPNQKKHHLEAEEAQRRQREKEARLRLEFEKKVDPKTKKVTFTSATIRQTMLRNNIINL
jgi:Cu/Ag efflux protein CusF